jgi:hypothetical protein
VRRTVKIFYCLAVFISGAFCTAFAKTSFIRKSPQDDSIAMALVERFEQTRPQGSPYFKNIDTRNFIDNMKRRIIAPYKFCQGFGSQFCGPAALIANTLIEGNPVGYVQLMIDFYNQGEAVYFNGKDSIRLAPDEQTRSYAGRILEGKNEPEAKRRLRRGLEYANNSELLSENDADQLILLCLKYRYPGLFGRGTFQRGDATKRVGFGATMFRQFTLIAGEFFALQYIAKGASLHDFLPLSKKVWTTLQEACAQNKTVYLMVDGPYFRKQSEFVFWGSHFIRLFDVRDNGKTIDLDIWDYGYRRWVTGYDRERFFSALTAYLIVE